MMTCGLEHPFDHFRSPVPAVSSPHLPCIPSLPSGMSVSEAEEVLALCKPCPAITETSLYYNTVFSKKPKTQLCTSPCDEN